MATDAAPNPLLSTQKSSDSLQVVLHPLVILSVSDYITRHGLRQQQGPIVGALLGQQNGREITIEHAFDCLVKADSGQVLLDQDWFSKRLDQMKLVHKDRLLDLVGWYTLLPTVGPQPAILPLHSQILSEFNESAVLLGFHPEEVLDHSVGGKLPVTIYESISEVEDASKEAAADGEDEEMKDGGNAAPAPAAAAATFKIKFRELPYTVETGEAEMISMDFVARGAANAAAAEAPKETKVAVEGDAKGKRRLVAHEADGAAADANALSREDEELISALTAKANAIKMLHARIELITKYLENLPPSYLSAEGETTTTAEATTTTTTTDQQQQHTTPSHTILRSIQGLVNRLALVNTASNEAFEREVLSESNDVHLVSLLNDVMQSVKDVREVGKKFAVVEVAKTQKARMTEHGGSQGGNFASFSLGAAGDIIV